MAHVYAFVHKRRCVSAELQERLHHDITYAPSSGIRCVISNISRNLRAVPLTTPARNRRCDSSMSRCDLLLRR